MANSYTLTDLADLCHNNIRMIGTLTEFAADAYVKNNVGVVKYKGVVNCNDAFITIKATTTSFDDTFKQFVDEFNNDVIGRKVFIIGKLNGALGVSVDYIALAYQDDYFEGSVVGVPYEDDKILIVDNDYHMILPLYIERDFPKNALTEYILQTNGMIFESDAMKAMDSPCILKDGGWPFIKCYGVKTIEEIENAEEIIAQALEEHTIYLEAMQQIKEGR